MGITYPVSRPVERQNVHMDGWGYFGAWGAATIAAVAAIYNALIARRTQEQDKEDQESANIVVAERTDMAQFRRELLESTNRLSDKLELLQERLHQAEMKAVILESQNATLQSLVSETLRRLETIAAFMAEGQSKSDLRDIVDDLKRVLLRNDG